MPHPTRPSFLTTSLRFLTLALLDNYHGNDESFSIDRGFIPGIRANLLFYKYMGEVGK